MKNILSNITGTKLLLLGIFILLMVGISNIGSSGATEDPDSALKVAKERMLQAQRGHCSVIGARVQACYTGNKEECDKIEASEMWFVSEYGQVPRVACASDSLFLGEGL